MYEGRDAHGQSDFEEMVSTEDGSSSAGSELHLRDCMSQRTYISQPDSQDSAAHQESGFVFTLYQECLQLLSQIWKTFRSQFSRASKQQLQESHTRFVLWGSGWNEGRLDYCLNGSIELRSNVTELLSDLAKALLQLCNSSEQFLTPAIREHIRALTSLREQARQIHVQEDDSEASGNDSPGSDDDSSFSVPSMGLQHRSGDDIKFHTQCLMDLLPSMEQTYKHVRDPGSSLEGKNGIFAFHVTEAARPYVLQVHDKFRSAAISLVERLGEANWQRHVRIRQYMASGIQDDAPDDLRIGARSAFFPASKFHDSALGSSIPTNSSFAATVASHSSFVSSLTEKEGYRARVPSTPTEVWRGLPFTCFICKRTLTNIKNRVGWKIHVFADLQPYICTFERCRSVLVTFASRKAWSEHEFTHHRLCRDLDCHLCSAIFSTENDLAEHLQLKHDLPHHRCKLLAASSFAKPNDSVSAKHEECPLCLQKGWLSQREFVTHLGHHFEEIALSVLPREVDSDSDEHSDNDEIPEDTNLSLHSYAQGGNPTLAYESPEKTWSREDPTSNIADQYFSTKSNRRPISSSSDWDKIKGDLETLYCKSEWPLRKVKDAIQKQHNVSVTEKQLKDKIARWKFGRNLYASDVPHLIRAFWEADLYETKPQVKIRGRVIPRHKLAMYLKRKGKTEDEILAAADASQAIPDHIKLEFPHAEGVSTDAHVQTQQADPSPLATTTLSSSTILKDSHTDPVTSASTPGSLPENPHGQTDVPSLPLEEKVVGEVEPAEEWSELDDEILLKAREDSMAWEAIHEKHFPSRSLDACQNRHERLKLEGRRSRNEEIRLIRRAAEWIKGREPELNAYWDRQREADMRSNE